MEYTYNNNEIHLTVDNFSVGETLESGQCFRFSKISDNHYTNIAFGRKINLVQDGNNIKIFPCTLEDFLQIWVPYFDLNTDYEKIKKQISENDPLMQRAISYAQGIRILNQDFFECLIGFIISQRSNIKRIMFSMERFCEKFGEFNGDYYCFPDPSKLGSILLEDVIDCKVGYRAKYILDAIDKFNNGLLTYDNFKNMTSDEIKQNLLSVNGIGDKVANCVMLFGCGVQDMFPVDVWIRRAMLKGYFNGNEASDKEIINFAFEKFGKNSGYAQQYLFHYIRMNKGDILC